MSSRHEDLSGIPATTLIEPIGRNVTNCSSGSVAYEMALQACRDQSGNDSLALEFPLRGLADRPRVACCSFPCDGTRGRPELVA